MRSALVRLLRLSDHPVKTFGSTEAFMEHANVADVSASLLLTRNLRAEPAGSATSVARDAPDYLHFLSCHAGHRGRRDEAGAADFTARERRGAQQAAQPARGQ